MAINDTNAFEYLRKVAAKYGTLYFTPEFEAFVAKISDDQLNEIKSAYDTINVRADSNRISSWIEHCIKNRADVEATEASFAQQVGQLFPLFRHLGAKGIAPFSSGEVAFINRFTKPDWSNLPSELGYLAEVAEIYGVFYSESDILAFLDSANEKDMGILAATAQKIRANGDIKVINKWLDRFPIDEHNEAALIYFLLGVLDHAGLKFE